MRFLIEVIATNRIRKMHINHSPRGEDGFLIRITERREYLHNVTYSFLYRQTISLACSCTYLATCFKEYLRIVVFLEGVEVLLGDALWHKLFPRTRVNVLSKVVDSDVFTILQVATIDEHWHTDGDTAKDADGILAHLLFLLHLFASSLFLIGKRCLRFLFCPVITSCFLFVKATIIDNDVLAGVLRWSAADDTFQFIKLFNLHVIQFKETIVV